MKKQIKKEPNIKSEFNIKSESQSKSDSDIKPESGVRGIYKRDYLRISTKSEESNLFNLNKILNFSSAVKKEFTIIKEDTPLTERTRSKYEKEKKKKEAQIKSTRYLGSRIFNIYV